MDSQTNQKPCQESGPNLTPKAFANSSPVVGTTLDPHVLKALETLKALAQSCLNWSTLSALEAQAA